MLLDVSKMRGTHDRVQRTYAASDFGSTDDDYRISQPVVLNIDVVKKNREVRLTGHVSTVLELQCGRCLESFALPVNATFDLMYLPHSENAGEGEIEVEEDDLNTGFYRDEVIDLGQLMREQFYLALPMKPLCQGECKGLCPYCGINLNQASCTCAPAWVDPRLEALKSLIKKDQ